VGRRPLGHRKCFQASVLVALQPLIGIRHQNATSQIDFVGKSSCKEITQKSNEHLMATLPPYKLVSTSQVTTDSALPLCCALSVRITLKSLISCMSHLIRRHIRFCFSFSTFAPPVCFSLRRYCCNDVLQVESSFGTGYCRLVRWALDEPLDDEDQDDQPD
jgi:hypothetical protein